MIRVGVVGASSWGRTMHLPVMRAIHASGKADYTGVCDLDAARAADFARELDSRPFADLDTLVRSTHPDALVLLVNPPAMPEVVRASIRLGLPFLAEKPPATDTATHLELERAAGMLPHVVAYNRRHSPYVTQAREWLEGIVPQLVCVQFSRHRRFDADFSTTAVHPIDTALFLAGSSPRQVLLECAPALREAGEPEKAVLNYYLGCWTHAGTRVEMLITPDTASSVEHYTVRSARRTVVVAFPQTGMLDFPGYVELQEEERIACRLGAADFGIDPADAPALGGIRGEHLRFLEVLAGTASSVSTLSSTLPTQRIRESLAALMRRGSEGKTELELEAGSA